MILAGQKKKAINPPNHDPPCSLQNIPYTRRRRKMPQKAYTTPQTRTDAPATAYHGSSPRWQAYNPSVPFEYILAPLPDEQTTTRRVDKARSAGGCDEENTHSAHFTTIEIQAQDTENKTPTSCTRKERQAKQQREQADKETTTNCNDDDNDHDSIKLRPRQRVSLFPFSHANLHTARHPPQSKVHARSNNPRRHLKT